ncbi:TetR/AcrR family transcriptional regulator [[Mycobacterium] crassicus]|uniref:TetR family transcriptional regulator n=1 Tax=[Mycobacterium] crassicus TaxID=2872309 RepID=A0ABU5XRS0_9MYCO|nr:TetR family transcriptional regulator [Mycolicibacter sp. MYC098]MEB3024002.1 TetR family transcriptional regulator [Mycolicibacter sp. MYC098]
MSAPENGNAAGRRPGRPSGASDTRDRILDSARELFARNGFGNTSVRAVAADAGVDAALVHHYYGSKQQLFAAATQLPVDPMAVLGPMRETPVEQLGRVLPEVLLPLWDSQAGTAMIAALRSMLTGTEVPLARSFLRDIVVAELSRRVDEPAGTGVLRAEFAASQLMGIVVARYVIGLEPLASMPPEQIVAMIAPTLQRYLTGDLPEAPAR